MKADLGKLEAAQDLSSQGEWDRALAIYREVLASTPDSLKAQFGCGLALQGLGDHRTARTAFGKVIERAPTIAQAWYSRAVSQSVLERHVEALADCRQALSLEPNFDDAAYLCGSSLKALGRNEEAISILSQLLDRTPAYHEARYCRATVAILLSDFRLAMDDLDIYLAEDAPPFAALQLRGLAAYESGMLEDALRFFELAIDNDPHNTSCLARRGATLAKLGRTAEAEETFARVKTLLDKPRGH